jgi:peptidoglycan/LPS O-acetylase OafA/YrhL
MRPTQREVSASSVSALVLGLLVVLVASLTLGSVSFRYVESPFLARKRALLAAAGTAKQSVAP